MAKIRVYDINDEEEIVNLGKAFSSPDRVKIFKMLLTQSAIISDMAKALNLSQSSVAFHLKILEDAGLVRMEKVPGKHGTSKLCSKKIDYANIRLLENGGLTNEIYSMEMSVGNFTECNVSPTCGLFSEKGVIGMEDQEYSFYLPERQTAGLLWTSRGYVVYRFANMLHKIDEPKTIVFTMEICSEAPGYREDWKSDITFWINGIECATWTCPGDYGRRRGRLTPPTWEMGQSQYGELIVLEVKEDGCYFNKEKVSDIMIGNLNIKELPYIELKIGNKENAYYVGGFNIFGKGFGNYDQGIVMTIEC